MEKKFFLLRACLKIKRGPVFAQKAGWRDATSEHIPRGSVSEKQRSQAAFLRENPPGGASFARGQRWLVACSPLRGCSHLAALATAKIRCRRPPFNSQPGSEMRAISGASLAKCGDSRTFSLGICRPQSLTWLISNSPLASVRILGYFETR